MQAVAIDTWLKEQEVHWDAPLSPAPVAEWLSGKSLIPLSQGIQTRVFRIEGEPWIVKEARWDLEVDLLKTFRLPLYARMTERILKTFSFSFLPNEEHMREQRERYAQAAMYLGYGSEIQRSIRASLNASPEILSVQEMQRLQNSPAMEHDFLPTEYVVYGPSISPQNKGKHTFYLFQSFAEGKQLHDVDIHSLKGETRDQLMIFLLLTIAMYEQIGLVPDTRPRYVLAEANDWLTKTDNIIVGKDGLTFVDTGWFWERNASLVRRGFVLPERTVGHAKSLLKELGAQA